jgi:hypothetical protein
LAKSGHVSLFYHFGEPLLLINAKIAEVSESKSKTPVSGQHLETEFVPNDTGIVIHFIGPGTRFPQQP